MKNSTINILCATDDNYVPYCGIMITSLFENNKESKVCVYVLIDKPLSPRNSKKFAKLAAKYGQQIECVMVDKSYLENFPIKGMNYWSIATYYRLYAEALLPKSVDKVLYLDCDIIVTGSLAPLWELDMTDKAVGAVVDLYYNDSSICERLLYPPADTYFNAGSLLINLSYWRTHQVGQQCLDFLRYHYDCIYANDQDVLNAVLHNKKVDLPLTDNYQIQFLKDYFYTQYDSDMQQKIKQVQKPLIIHYASPMKPWMCLYYKMPFLPEWKYYKRRSQWWYLLPQMPTKKKLNYLIKRYLLWPLGIMWTNYYNN